MIYQEMNAVKRQWNTRQIINHFKYQKNTLKKKDVNYSLW